MQKTNENGSKQIKIETLPSSETLDEFLNDLLHPKKLSTNLEISDTTCCVRPPEKSSNLISISEYQMSYVNHQHKYSTNTNSKEKTNDLTRFDNLSTSSKQKGEDLIQSTELQGLQIDLKIQLENLHNLPQNSLKQTLKLSNTILLLVGYNLGTETVLIQQEKRKPNPQFGSKSESKLNLKRVLNLG